MVAGGAGCRHGPGQLPLDDLGRCEPARLDQAPQRVEAEGQPGPSEIDAAAAVKREQQRRDGETALPGIEPEMNEIDIDRLEQLLERCPVAGLDAMAMRRRTSRQDEADAAGPERQVGRDLPIGCTGERHVGPLHHRPAAGRQAELSGIPGRALERLDRDAVARRRDQGLERRALHRLAHAIEPVRFRNGRKIDSQRGIGHCRVVQQQGNGRKSTTRKR